MFRNHVILVILFILLIIVLNIYYHYTELPNLNIKQMEIGNSAHKFNDISFLFDRLKDKRIIILGEQQHIDGRTFLLKSDIIRYLHEKMEFNVVLYESGLYDMWQMDAESDTLNPALGLYQFWWNNEECTNLWEYYRQTKHTIHPIHLGGFDIQFTGNIEDSVRVEKLDEHLLKKGIITEDYSHFSRIKEHLPRYIWPQLVDLVGVNKDSILKDLDMILMKLKKDKNPSTEDLIYYRYINGFRLRYESVWNNNIGELSRMQLRDSLMADNLTWFVDSIYKNEKVVVWMANTHALNNKVGMSKGFTPMGYRLKKRYGDDLYTVVFSSYGRFNESKDLSKKLSNKSLEYILHICAMNNSYIDFQRISETSYLKQSFVSGIVGGECINASWAKTTDMLIYIDTMTTITLLN